MNTTIAASVGGITVFAIRLGTTKKYAAWRRGGALLVELNAHIL